MTETWNAAELPTANVQLYVISVPGYDDGTHLYELVTWVTP